MLERQKRSGFEGTLTPPRFMGRTAASERQRLDIMRDKKPLGRTLRLAVSTGAELR